MQRLYLRIYLAVLASLAVFALAECPRSSLEAYLRRLAAAYKQFDLAAGNGLVARPLRLPPGELGTCDALTRLRFLGGLRSVSILNTHEIAGLWHLPQADQVLARTGTALTEKLKTFTRERQAQSECEARATNHLVQQALPVAAKSLWVGSRTPAGDMKPTDEDILSQARTSQTKAVAARVLALLEEYGIK